VKQNDEVVLIGHQGLDTITLQELAEKAGTIPHEIMASLSYRVVRYYVKENKPASVNPIVETQANE
jgi:alanine racemase